MDWIKFWDEKASLDPFSATGRSKTDLAGLFAYMLDVVRKLRLERSDTLLDIGCGVGLVAQHLARHVADYRGFDASCQQIEQSCVSGDFDLFVWDIRDWMSDARADRMRSNKVLVGSVLQYLPESDIAVALENVHALTARGGRALFTLNPNARKRCLYQPTEPEAKAAADAATWFLPNKLRGQALAAGFKRVKVSLPAAWQRRYMFDLECEA
jgi:trans-aconitate methyltransferase